MKKDIEVKLEERAAVLGEKFERILGPLAAKGSGEELKRAERLRDYSVEFTSRMVEIMDPKRDLRESRILVLENGSGVMSHRLSAGDTDVVGAAPTEAAARMAQSLNPFPSIIYRSLFSPLVEDSYDLVVDGGVLSYFSRPLLEPLVQHLASLCRRKMILEFRIPEPFFERLFGPRSALDDSDLRLESTLMSEDEIIYLMENGCGMIVTERRAEAGRMLIKALRKPHSRQAYISPLK